MHMKVGLNVAKVRLDSDPLVVISGNNSPAVVLLQVDDFAEAVA